METKILGKRGEDFLFYLWYNAISKYCGDRRTAKWQLSCFA